MRWESIISGTEKPLRFATSGLPERFVMNTPAVIRTENQTCLLFRRIIAAGTVPIGEA